MEVQQVLHMNWGNGETSYATNSKLQELVINKAKPVVIGSISDLYTTNLPRCLRVADLGCSSGPNTLLVISEIIDAIDETCHQLKLTTPEFQVFLNDLPSNDFNTIFKTLPAFYDQLKKEKGDKFGPCSITGLPGSFYDRLFPTSTIDFLHSSYSLHWLSQGLIEEAKVDSFNLPFYMPSHKELEAVVCEEGSFYLDQLQIFDVNWDGSDDDDDNNKAGFMFDRFISGQKMAKCVRAVAEPMIACHFGETVIDILFNRYMEYVSDHLSKEEGKFVNFVISLKGK
ncbi:probable jasmonic acid carboxyl methyltransferase 2 isoform X2 [Telopea speciosissima]|uniref:probable jasmonic acid carboxyl methyltransferase 2 isoform X2 n=1 Tax=Telopea speciosissima TaxID=54955 RepID=UPI001CC4D227|nr:probable jasmonic acid carboxyl methyltransferase 2 isoform X2 [Telopea speciosissima]